MPQRPGDEEARQAGGGADEFWRRYTGRSEADQPPAGARPGPEPGAGSAADAGTGADAGSDRRHGEPARDSSGAGGDPYAGADSGARPRAGSGGGGSTPFDHGIEEHECLEWCPICRGAEVLRASVPPELREQYQVVQRDILRLAQAAIESHLARLQDEGPGRGARGRSSDGPGSARDTGPAGDPGIRDIPID